MKARTRVGLLMLFLTLVASPLFAQPRRERGRDADRGDMRTMVESRLEATRQRAQSLEDLLALIDSGATEEEIRGKMREAFAESREGDGDRGRRGHRRGGAKDGEVLEAIDPHMRRRFEDMKRDHPERAERMMERAGPRLERLNRLREEDPARFEAQIELTKSTRQAMRAAHEIVRLSADGADQTEIDAKKDDFALLVGHAVDTGIQVQEMELGNARERFDKLESEVARKRDNRDEIVADRMEELLAGAVRRMTDQQGRNRRRD